MFLLLIGSSFVQSFSTGTNLKRITYKAWRDKYQALQRNRNMEGIIKTALKIIKKKIESTYK